MLTLLSPAALWSLAALALPVGLHLWRQPPRTVRLPSLRFLPLHASRRWHALRWRERLLLLARVALLALFACLLAGPSWQRQPSAHPQRWLLLDPLAAPAGPSAERLRSLQAAGCIPHLLTPGLPIFSQALPPSKDTAVSPPDLWSLLREADAALPPGSTLTVFSPTRLAGLRGLRPALRSKTEWVTTPTPTGSSPHLWLASLVSASTLLPTIGASNASSVRFGNLPPDGWKLETRPGAARLLGPNAETTPWQTGTAPPTLRVQILHDPTRSEDARILAAALRAAVPTSSPSLNLHTADTTADLTSLPATDWTFWLASTPPPAAIENRHTHLFADSATSGGPTRSRIVAQPATPGAAFLSPAIALWRRGASPPGVVIWTDATGSPLLTRQDREHGPFWHFTSRFDPLWTDFPQTTAFPAFLRSLLLSDSPVSTEHDFRLAATDQARPADPISTAPGTAPLPPTVSPAYDLHAALWHLVALLFVLERCLSHYRPLPSRSAVAPTVTSPVPASTR